jgi:Flp pilus assembly pilin Flp
MGVYINLKILLAGLSDRGSDSEDGASLVEYALLVALLALVALIAVAAFGGALSTEYSDIADSLP